MIRKPLSAIGVYDRLFLRKYEIVYLDAAFAMRSGFSQDYLIIKKREVHVLDKLTRNRLRIYNTQHPKRELKIVLQLLKSRR